MCLIINLSDFNRNHSLKLIFNYCSKGNYNYYYTVSITVFFYKHELKNKKYKREEKITVNHSIYLFYLLINKILLKVLDEYGFNST